MKTIKIKKSEFATVKGLGISNDGIAAKFGITPKEVTDAMIQFGLSKSRKPAKEYTIELIDDITVTETVSNDQAVSA